MIPHFCVLTVIIILSTIYYFYNVYLPSTKNNDKLVSPESFLSFDQEYSKIIERTIEPKYLSRFNTYNEYKIQ